MDSAASEGVPPQRISKVKPPSPRRDLEEPSGRGTLAYFNET
ncbi:MAG: hypothetical protein ABSE74_05520 [Methanoregula sp.]